MKGGITSGVVYPRAAVALARRYRLVNVGGASAGAIAAALSAAAETGEAGEGLGYEGLAALSDELARPGASGETTALLALFQPGPATRPLYRLLLDVLAAPPDVRSRIRAGITWGVVRAFQVRGGWWKVTAAVVPAVVVAVLARPGLQDVPGGVLLAVLLLAVALVPAAGLRREPALLGSLVAVELAVQATVLLDSPATSWLLAVCLLLAVVGVVAGAATALVLAGLRQVRANGVGLVDGMGNGHALTPWLHGKLNDLAGTGGRVLTFADLWGAGDAEAKRRLEHDRAGRRVNLELMTTNLSEGRPQRQPGSSTDYFYDPDELARLFPADVISHLRDIEQPPRPNADAAERLEYALWTRALGLRRLPIADLPVIVATRMSMSFPVLLAPVPLYTIDWTRDQNTEARAWWRKWIRGLPRGVDPLEHPDLARMVGEEPYRFRRSRCWISDGGITSNMPLHFFDAPLPRWPTFAIDLRRHHPDHVPLRDAPARDHVFLAETNRQGREITVRMDDPLRPPSVFAFLASILDCMQNWVDSAQSRMPGYRERIVHIGHFADEGGMNLGMGEKSIEALAERGAVAGERLVERFADGDGWENHRWVRFRSYMAMMEQVNTNAAGAFDAENPRSRTYRRLLDDPTTRLPSYPFKLKGQTRWARFRTKAFMDLAGRWFEPVPGREPPEGHFGDGAPEPAPEMRAQPHL